MTRLVAVVALVLMPAPPVIAGQDTSPDMQQVEQQVQQRLQEIKERLELTPEQIEKIRPLLTEEIQKLRALRERYDGDEQTLLTRLRMGRELRAVQNATDEQLKKILSEKQMEEVGKIREEGRERFLERAGRN